MKQIKPFLLIILSLTFLAGCGIKEVEPSVDSSISSDSITTLPTSPAATITPLPASPTPSVSSSTYQSTDEDDQIDITLYLYGPDDYDNPIEKKVISVSKELYKNNITEALNNVFQETEIRINSATVEKETNCITVDITQEVAMHFNAGSCGGTILSNELKDTILNLPDIQSAIITVDGEKDSFADHYSFEGIFTKDED